MSGTTLKEAMASWCPQRWGAWYKSQNLALPHNLREAMAKTQKSRLAEISPHSSLGCVLVAADGV